MNGGFAVPVFLLFSFLLLLAISRNITYLVGAYRLSTNALSVLYPITPLLSTYFEENITMHRDDHSYYMEDFDNRNCSCQHFVLPLWSGNDFSAVQSSSGSQYREWISLGAGTTRCYPGEKVLL
ncbi:MAG: hypothetical protein D3908_12155 [Candidatus Electrothrix sp. AUS4]|nr:hypothetical protein [Candidatus Electrothrix sp. AUS4]